MRMDWSAKQSGESLKKRTPLKTYEIHGLTMELWPGGDLVILPHKQTTLTPPMVRSFIRQLQEIQIDHVLRFAGSSRDTDR